jgi:hypothetical protein
LLEFRINLYFGQDKKGGGILCSFQWEKEPQQAQVWPLVSKLQLSPFLPAFFLPEQPELVPIVPFLHSLQTCRELNQVNPTSFT